MINAAPNKSVLSFFQLCLQLLPNNSVFLINVSSASSSPWTPPLWSILPIRTMLLAVPPARGTASDQQPHFV